MPPMLTTIERRISLLKQYGADSVVVLRVQPRAVAADRGRVRRADAASSGSTRSRIVVGANFRFGHRAAGDVALLRKFGLEVDDVPLLATTARCCPRPRSARWSRRATSAAAAAALGRLHLVEGPVVRGDARGRELGYPTANVAVDPTHRDPGGRGLRRLAGPRAAARAAARRPISVGTNPTFDGATRRVEAYVDRRGPRPRPLRRARDRRVRRAAAGHGALRHGRRAGRPDGGATSSQARTRLH